MRGVTIELMEGPNWGPYEASSWVPIELMVGPHGGSNGVQVRVPIELIGGLERGSADRSAREVRPPPPARGGVNLPGGPTGGPPLETSY